MKWLRDYRFRKHRKAMMEVLQNTRMTVNSERKEPNTLMRTFGFQDESPTSEQHFRELSEDELFDLPQPHLADLLIKTDPTIDSIVAQFVSNTTISYSLTCENPQGQRLLDDFIKLLERKKNPIQVFLSRLANSALVRGNLCAEIVIDPMRMPSNLFCVDPQYVDFEKKADDVDGEVWKPGQFRFGKFEEFTAETIVWMSLNPLLAEYEVKGRSQIGTAFPSVISENLTMQDLRKIIANHAWIQKMIAIDQAELLKAGFSADEVAQIVKADIELVQEIWPRLKKEETPIGTGEIELRQYEGANSGNGLQWVETFSRNNDRKIARGGKATPSSIGSNEFVAESSSEFQGLREAWWLEHHQDLLEHVTTYLLTIPLRLQGITENPVFALKRNNALEREIEARIFSTLFEGIKKATESGIPIHLALQLYEHITATQFPEELLMAIEEQAEAPPDENETDTDTESGTDAE